jgi:hypothetical protein
VSLTRSLTADQSFDKWIKDSRLSKTDSPKGGRIIVFDLRGQAEQALQADQRLAEESGALAA